MVPLSFANHQFQVVDSVALYWADQNALLVADLHLEKASWYASHGQHLPPYDSHATLTRLRTAIELTGARRIYCLGDNFHDSGGEHRIGGDALDILADMTARLDWVWITGNHDHALGGAVGGDVVKEHHVCGIALRHEAIADAPTAQISGHYHPKFGLHLRGRHVRRACFVRSPVSLLLPAFGSLTGGMAADDPAILASFGRDRPVEALVATRDKMVKFVLARSEKRQFLSLDNN